MGKDTFEALGSWQKLNAALPKMREVQLENLMAREKLTKRRTLYLLRIYGRYSVVRAERERRELLK